MLSANITNIQHFNVHDGPGFRTIVFLQGCSLRCKWCQNPETIQMNPRIMYDPSLCIGCGACIEACPSHAISVQDGRLITNLKKCTSCGACEKECYTLARSLSSKEMTIDEVYAEVMKDRIAYQKSGGGITLSGGEPLLHIDFCTELLKRIKQDGISTAVETACHVPTENMVRIAPYVDTFLCDFKTYSKSRHIEWIRQDNTLILQNLKKITDIHDNVVIRIPLIPTVNDSDEEFTNMMKFVKGLRKINSIHLLPFHHLGSNKYDLLGDSYEMLDHLDDNEERILACQDIAIAFGFRTNIGGTGFANDKFTAGKTCSAQL